MAHASAETKPGKEMKSKICLITGATSGVGRATAMGLAKQGATVVIPCRNQARGEQAAREIARQTRNPNIEVMNVDLSSLDSVRSFAQAFQGRFPALHVLSNNAAVLPLRRKASIDGVEMIFAVNYLGHFLLTNLLKPCLEKGAPSRVLTVSGNPGPLQYVSLEVDCLGKPSRLNPLTATVRAAFAKVLFSLELAKQWQGLGISSNTFHPGLVRSNLARSVPWFLKPAVAAFEFFLRPECPTAVYLASSPDVEEVTGGFFANRKQVPFALKRVPAYAGARLWEASARLAGLS